MNEALSIYGSDHVACADMPFQWNQQCEHGNDCDYAIDDYSLCVLQSMLTPSANDIKMNHVIWTHVLDLKCLWIKKDRWNGTELCHGENK